MLCDFDPRPILNALADAAGRETLAHFRTALSVQNKAASGFDPVTAADRSAERAIRDVLRHARPEDAIWGEEDGDTPGQSPFRWVIDPIDGTRAFVAGVPMWTTLIGLERDGVPFAGVIDQPFTGERFLGVAGMGASLAHRGNISPVRPSSVTALAHARLAVTDIRTDAYFTSEESARVHGLARNARILRQGLDAYGFALIALGTIDLAIEAGAQWYDVAGPIGVLRAAGATVTDWAGAALSAETFRGQIIAAATPELARAAVAALGRAP